VTQEKALHKRCVRKDTPYSLPVYTCYAGCIHGLSL